MQIEYTADQQDKIDSRNSTVTFTEKWFTPVTFQKLLIKHYGNNESIALCTQDDSFEQLCFDQGINYTTNYLESVRSEKKTLFSYFES